MMKLFMFMIMLLFFMNLNKNKINIVASNYLILLILLLLYLTKFMNNWNLFYLNIGVDLYSLILIILSIFIISMMFKVMNCVKYKKLFFLNLMIMNFILFYCFSTMNYFYFYLFFEVSLIPMFMLIVGWGYQPERLNASIYMMLYTLFASLPLLMIIFYLFEYFNSLNYLILLDNIMNFSYFNNFIFYFYCIFSFLIKFPMFMIHLWLPKAHLEAPVGGSMLLAAVMLKLGGYGLIRTMMMMINFSIYYNYIFIIISILGMIYLSILCLNLIDMKLIVAYSSVIHMGISITGLMTLMNMGMKGGFMMMIGHGLCSSSLFILVNYNYLKINSRNMYLNKGYHYYNPVLMLWWFLFCIINMSAPISINLLSEIFVMNSFIWWLMEFMIFMLLNMFLCTLYNLYLYSYLSHSYNFAMVKMSINKSIDYFILIIHWILNNFLILKIKLLI